MKNLILLSSIFLPILIACNNHKSNTAIVIDSLSHRKDTSPEQLSYYKCNYSQKGYDTILTSGSSKIDEVWGINEGDLRNFPRVDISCLDFAKFMDIASAHLKKRFPTVPLDILLSP